MMQTNACSSCSLHCAAPPACAARGRIAEERHIHEECGVFGVYSETTADVASLAYYALYALQHRGQESAGIAVNDDGVFTSYRDVGLVSEVFPQERLRALGTGNIAVGHVRYGTTGSDNKRNVQPILVNHYKGRMALAHNGNLTNSHELRSELESRGSIFQTTTDSEVIAYIIVQERLRTPSIEEAVAAAMDRIEGAYSLVISSPTKLIAARDPHGFRPLCMGRLKDGSVVFASESCALDAVGARFERDIRPGEIVVADRSGVKSDTRHCNKVPKRLCVFEFIYFARPDSVIDGSSVHVARQRAGAFLALEHPVQADIVVGVPDSGLDAALGYARQSGIPYGMGFIKNKYIWPYLHLPHPVHAGKRGQHQAQPHSLRGGGQARGADRRLHRPRHHLPPDHRPAAPGRSQGDPHAGQRATLRGRLLLRHRHRRPQQAYRQQPLRGGDRQDHRRGLPGLSEPAGRGEAGGQHGGRLLHRLFRRRLSHLRSSRTAARTALSAEISEKEKQHA